MAIYHLTVKTLSKARGQSAAAKFNYITRTGKYARQKDPCLLRGHTNMPAFAKEDVSKYWKATDKHERKNATLAREIEVALPKELNLQQQQELVQSFIARVAPSMPVSYAIHRGYGRNPHAHILISERVNDGITRTPDKWFRRANPSDPARGGARKARLGKDRSWLQNTRKTWASVTNETLKKAGHNIEIDHRSNRDRGIREPPSITVGMTWHSKDKTNPRVQKYIERKKQKRNYRRNAMNSMKPATRTPSPKRDKRDEGIQIPDLKPVAQGTGVIIWAWADSGKAAIIDYGDNISVTTGSLAEWRRASMLAKAKGWTSVENHVANKQAAYNAIRADLEQGLTVTRMTVDGKEIDKETLQKWIKKVADDHNLTIPNSEEKKADADAAPAPKKEAAETVKPEAQQEYVRPGKEEIRRAIYGTMLDYSKAKDMLKNASNAHSIDNKIENKEALLAKHDIAETLGNFMTENPTAGKVALAQIVKVLPRGSTDREHFIHALAPHITCKLDNIDEIAAKYADADDLYDIKPIQDDVDAIMKKYGFDKIDMTDRERETFAYELKDTLSHSDTFKEIKQAHEQAQDMDMDMDMEM